MKKIYRLIFVLHVFVGLGAMAGGISAIMNPYSPLGLHSDTLKYSPFSNFLIPGIILFVVIGLGNLFSAISILFKSKYQGYISSIFSWALVIWIIVQCIMLRAIAHLHVIFFVIGLIQAFFSIIVLFNQRLFPTNIILTIIRKLQVKFPESSILKRINKLENKFYKA
ncbi:hypothetical protein R0131_06945 [Clostridium sp. AL.422]|uniref:hypothetical protein n=1 Tax=Clostridium TaxID=1485 RepID=UPI00293DAE36|nr:MULTISPECIES: hypothetical protein [unclassified Clostridium]MDV4150569.1 hypothetical protein [Clostridium sp. AL.422]